MAQRSITRRLITAVLLLELLSALALVGLTTLHETRVRLHAFDVTLRGRADTLLGAVADSEDAADHLSLSTAGITLPKQDIFSVEDEDPEAPLAGPVAGQLAGRQATAHILGRSAKWPAESLARARTDRDGTLHLRFGDEEYHVVRTRGLRIIDPGDHGGITHHVTVFYGAPTRRVWEEIGEAVRFYSLASLLLVALTGCVMAWFLRRGLAPLLELAREAGRVSGQQWKFMAPESARRTRELAPLAEAIEAALDRLQETFQQQRRFTSDAAHELKTDVAIVKSSLQLLAMRPRSVEEYRQGLEVSMTDCMRMEGTVQEMLTLAGLQYASQHTSAAVIRSDLTVYAREAVVRLSSLAALREVNLDIESADSLGGGEVGLDAKECSLLCTNLLHNALLHSQPGSHVRIRISADGGWLRVSIEDEGEGIAADVLPHIFEPFFRGDPSRDRRSGGTGLGLAICKAICDKAGGTIEIISQAGAGARVEVRLPQLGAKQGVVRTGQAH